MITLYARIKDSRLFAVFMACMGFLLVLLLWNYISVCTEAGKLFPDPGRVFRQFYISLTEPIGSRTLPMHALVSLGRVMVGFGAAAIFGVVLGMAMGFSRMAEAIFSPLFEMIRCIPAIAWIPLAILWFGIGETTKYFIIFMGGFVHMVVNSYSGARRVDRDLISVAELFGAGRWQLYINVILPSAVPYVFAGLQYCLSACWMAVLAAEMVSSYEGLGWTIIMGMDNGDTVQIMTAMIAIGAVGFLLTQAMRVLERSLCSWKIRGN